LPEIIIKLLEKYHIPRSAMVFEVKESAIMQDPELALEVLNSMNQHGLVLSIDDYGTGYSSMSYLKKLPVKELKIDKSFVIGLASNREDEILVRSTIDLGHNLGLKVTAEGVEDEKSLELLKSYGSDTVQGYYISKPLPVADLNDFLKNSPFGLSEIPTSGHIMSSHSDNSLVRMLEHRLAKK
jgi:EAL domain-containing protein (putative c-di-GMP-specific phosphodiesterase class I)